MSKNFSQKGSQSSIMKKRNICFIQTFISYTIGIGNESYEIQFGIVRETFVNYELNFNSGLSLKFRPIFVQIHTVVSNRCV